MSGKILGLQLLFKILLTNQIAGFLKVRYLKNELSYEIDFFVCEYQMNWDWHDIGRNAQSPSKL